mmetsp:Transcript_12612/g.18869  ORF Transcript_12612/g.18869 Transcript_12612/m.18869 type:complete len:212 (+) Transcript_12612:790-1425(+)
MTGDSMIQLRISRTPCCQEALFSSRSSAFSSASILRSCSARNRFMISSFGIFPSSSDVILTTSPRLLALLSPLVLFSTSKILTVVAAVFFVTVVWICPISAFDLDSIRGTKVCSFPFSSTFGVALALGVFSTSASATPLLSTFSFSSSSVAGFSLINRSSTPSATCPAIPTFLATSVSATFTLKLPSSTLSHTSRSYQRPEGSISAVRPAI